MKKHFLTFVMLASITADAAVKITPLSANYSTQAVTFKVEWTTAPYNNRVWVWADFCSIAGTTPATSFSTATISNPTKTGGNGTITGVTARGFFIEYANTTNTGTTVTATLSNAAGKFNWCVYGSDYPPNVLANTNGSYTLAGTPPFKLIEANGTTMQTVIGKIIAISAVTITPATITDATGYPGLWCPYTGGDLYRDNTHRCRERQSGAYNWEAWIQDARDNKLYRIVLMPDNKWWLAQNVDYRSGNYQCGNNQIAYCDKYGIMLDLYDVVPIDICPDGWALPTVSEMQAIVSTETQMRKLRSTTSWTGDYNTTASPGTDDYGFTLHGTGYIERGGTEWAGEGTMCYLILHPTNNIINVHKEFMISGNADLIYLNRHVDWGWAGYMQVSGDDWGYVRCIRQL